MSSGQSLERIRDVLTDLMPQMGESVLIGGWASFLHLSNVAMSEDIDVILEPIGDLDRVKLLLSDVSRSQLSKIRGTYRGVHIDLYVPFQSLLGPLRVERLVPYAVEIDGWRVLCAEAHVLTKMVCLLSDGRLKSMKGEKDVDEISKFLERGVDAETSVRIWKEATSRPDTVLDDFTRIFAALRDRSRTSRKTIEKIERVWLREV